MISSTFLSTSVDWTRAPQMSLNLSALFFLVPLPTIFPYGSDITAGLDVGVVLELFRWFFSVILLNVLFVVVNCLKSVSFYRAGSAIHSKMPASLVRGATNPSLITGAMNSSSM